MYGKEAEAVNQEELQLYEAFGYYATEELFWSLVYLNNAAFHTPLKEDSKNKLISLNKTYATIITGIYPMDKCHDLVTAMANHNQLFVQYVETLMQGDSQTNVIRQKWKENGLKIANILNRMNPYWKVAEWSAMIGHEADLLESIATSLKIKNYTTFVNIVPICHRLAVDMCQYMCAGIANQGQRT